jgi:hypothetical protein
MVAIITTVLIPAPTVASVKATSTAPISAQSRHIKKLYTANTTDAGEQILHPQGDQSGHHKKQKY